MRTILRPTFASKHVLVEHLRYHRRIIIPYGEVTERGDISYKSDEMIGYEITISAYPSSDGVSVRRLFQEGWTPAAVEAAGTTA